MRALGAIAIAAAEVWTAAPAAARTAGEPIRLVWNEGDVAGMTTIYDAPDGAPRGEPIGVVEYQQQRDGDLLSTMRVARFRDGSSDEDTAVARVDGVLAAVKGRSLIRDTDGEVLVDLRIDVAGGRVDASWGRGTARRSVSKEIAPAPGTYWGALIFIALKNFEANAEDGRLVFRTVAPTPRPLVLDMELTRRDAVALERTGIRLTANEYVLRPTLHWAVDPLVGWLLPAAHFWALPGEPPALVRFAGPRNYRQQPIVIE